MAAKLSLTFSESAISDLGALLEYYNEQGVPDAGKRIVARILTKSEGLINHPAMGRVVPEFGLERLREMIDPPFRIIYVREKSKVRVVRVWRSERLLKLPGE
jgi:plasmid stabilization system protein ParE